MQVVVCSRSFSQNAFLRSQLLSHFPNAKFNDHGEQLSGQRLLDFVSDAEVIIVGLENFSADVFEALPKLKGISKYGVGIDNIDLVAASNANIKVEVEFGVNKQSVVELSLGFIISHCRSLPSHFSEVKKGSWKNVIGSNISELNIGILGMGNVGRQMANILSQFTGSGFLLRY